jgi:hypothetical protein
MNWSHSVVVFSGGGARANPPGVAPEASVEYLDSSEVFYAFYWGMVSNCGVIRVLLFEVWFVAVEPWSLVRTGSIRVSAVFCCSTLTLLSEERGGGVGNAVLPLFGRVLTVSGELLAREFECEPVLHSIGVG